MLSFMALLLATASNPQGHADLHEVTMINATERTFELLFQNGTHFYAFTQKANTTKIANVAEDTYDLEASICTDDETIDWTATVNINDDFVIIFDDPCPGDPIRTKFAVNSHFGEPITIELDGEEEDYSLEVELGRTRFDDVLAGEYFYSYDACDTTFSGIVKIAKAGNTVITLKSCERLAQEALIDEFGYPVPVKLRIANRFNFPVDITLIGPRVEFITVEPGLSLTEVVAGTYTYIYAVNGQRYEGTFFVKKSGSTILVVPPTLQP
jgi:hypothetical protein